MHLQHAIDRNAVTSQSRRKFLGDVAALGAALTMPQTVLASVAGTPLPKASSKVTPFTFEIPQVAIIDLITRLDATRWPDQETVGDRSQGATLRDARTLVEYWSRHYDWRRFEGRINKYPQFRTEIDGLGIHFIHVKSKHQDALPLVMTHGWPGSIVEFLDTIDFLTDPMSHSGVAEDAFHVVIPSIPGFGFSDKPTGAGWNAERTADAWGILMQRLGYTRWVAHGGDWGSLITHRLAQRKPSGLIAAHVNLPLVFPEETPANPTAEEQNALEDMSLLSRDGSGYAFLQGTRPQTLSYGLADSPVAQAMWIYEKLQAWSDNDGDVQKALSVDSMLDDISLYWFTNTAGSSARFYWEVFRTGFSNYSAGHIDLPMAATTFPREFYHAPRIWAEAAWPNLFYWSSAPHGGHFAAWEQPEIFAAELRKAFSRVR